MDSTIISFDSLILWRPGRIWRQCPSVINCKNLADLKNVLHCTANCDITSFFNMHPEDTILALNSVDMASYLRNLATTLYRPLRFCIDQLQDVNYMPTITSVATSRVLEIKLPLLWENATHQLHSPSTWSSSCQTTKRSTCTYWLECCYGQRTATSKPLAGHPRRRIQQFDDHLHIQNLHGEFIHVNGERHPWIHTSKVAHRRLQARCAHLVTHTIYLIKPPPQERHHGESNTVSRCCILTENNAWLCQGSFSQLTMPFYELNPSPLP